MNSSLALRTTGVFRSALNQKKASRLIVSIPKLLSALHRDRYFFEAMFEKRHRMVSLHEVLSSIDEEKLAFLLEAELLVNQEDTFELDDRVLSFFEETMETSGDVEIGDVDEMLDNMKHNINLYLHETHLASQERYLFKIQRILKKIPSMILKNLNLLQLHIGLTYKTQKSHENKIAELDHYKSKLEKLISIESKVEQALEIDEGFFKNLSSHETVILTLRLKGRLRELRISLTALQQEVIEYINKSLGNLAFYEHMIKLKELKNALELKERTNVLELLSKEVLPLSFEKSEHFSGFLETDYIYEEHFEEAIDKLRATHALPRLETQTARSIDASFFELAEQALSRVDIDALDLIFMEGSQELFEFVQEYTFNVEKSFNERIEIYCQMALMFEDSYRFSDEYATKEGFEYLKIYPQKGEV